MHAEIKKVCFGPDDNIAEFVIQQIDKSNRKFIVYIRSLNALNSILEKQGYKVIFKSALPWKPQLYIPSELSSEIKIVNLLYER